MVEATFAVGGGGLRLLRLKVHGCIVVVVVVVVNSLRQAETTSRDQSDKLIWLQRLTEPGNSAHLANSSAAGCTQHKIMGRSEGHGGEADNGLGQQLTALALTRIKAYFSMDSVIDGLTAPRTSELWMLGFNTLQSELRAGHVITRKAGPW